jgi:hypothetical protein
MKNDNISADETVKDVTEMKSVSLRNDLLKEVRNLKKQHEKMKFLNRSSIVDCKQEIKKLKKIIVNENIKMHKILTK